MSSVAGTGNAAASVPYRNPEFFHRSGGLEWVGLPQIECPAV